MNSVVNTVVVGGGQAGLAVSYYLTQQGRDHIVLEQSEHPAHVWRDERWDSFTFVTPNWSIQMPGTPRLGMPDGYLSRDDIIAYFETYVQQHRLPVRYRARVSAVEQKATGSGYTVTTENEVYDTQNVVVATGLFQTPKRPASSAKVSKDIVQLNHIDYRNPQSLPAGAVLVAGSGQSGCQIAEELYQCGRKVYLCVGTAGCVPRRYRGKDIVYWLESTGFFSRTPDKLPSPRAKFNANPQATGKDGGHTISLHQFARDGVVLLGHFLSAQGDVVSIAPDLHESLAKSDKIGNDLVAMIDSYISKNGLDYPTETLIQMRDGYSAPIVTELDLRSEGITSIVWAMGYNFDYSLVKLPVVDADGYPIQQRGVTNYPGLYFLGMPWLHNQKSGILLGVGDDAAYIASRIHSRSIPPMGQP
ncbi:MAG TPA: NAD(P)-binding domain-containing protein [Anaerolineae bacterium]|jgi:putative flavoprotein involved in K+ transport